MSHGDREAIHDPPRLQPGERNSTRVAYSLPDGKWQGRHAAPERVTAPQTLVKWLRDMYLDPRV